MHLLKKLAAGIVAVGLLLTGAVTARADEAKSVIDEIQSRGVLRVGLDTFVPWAFRDEDGNLVGFEVDVANRIAQDLGVKVELVPTAWDGIIPALLSGNFDVIIGGLSITPARSLKVNFTDPYESSGLLVAANTTTHPGLTSLEDFNKPEIVIAVKRGISAIDFIKSNLPSAQLRQFDDEAAVFQEVKNGNAAAFIASIPSPNQEVIRSNGALYLPFTEPVNASLEAFAVRKGDPDALNVFNNWILLRAADGWLDERHDYWFNGLEWASLVSQ